MVFLGVSAVLVPLLVGIFALAIGAVVGGLVSLHVKKSKDKEKIENAKDEAEQIIANAKDEGEKKKKELIQEGKDEIASLKDEAEKDIKERKSSVVEQENKLNQREDTLDRRSTNLDKREEILNSKETKIDEKKQEIEEQNNKVQEVLQAQEKKLVEIAGLNRDEAKKIIMDSVHEKMKTEIASYIKDEEEKAKTEVKAKAKNVLSLAIQKYAGETVQETTCTTVSLPAEEMKGRIIGREGRNIRAIESLTGVDLIIDDTPEAISLSSFDPLRREIAKITIETLIKDGRIHPGRIEEVYDKTLKDVNARIIQIGNQTINDLGITKMDPELVTLIGKLNFRTSYGQNALRHSIEVANLCGLMASELGENVSLAKRAGLLHDIGKAIDFEIEGSHVEIGYDFAKRHREPEVVLDAIASHHGDTESKSIIAVLVAIADTLSAARPGARNDSLENYIKRLEQLEQIGNSYEGVDKTFAMQAGRELRVIVKPEEIDDAKSYKMARDIKEKIEKEMQYPGTIKVTVIRETRVQEEAK